MKIMDWVPITYIYEYPGVPLKFSRLAGVTGQSTCQGFDGTVNTASLNLATVQGGHIVFANNFLWLISLEEAAPATIRSEYNYIYYLGVLLL